jgi:hypothetical protein
VGGGSGFVTPNALERFMENGVESGDGRVVLAYAA